VAVSSTAHVPVLQVSLVDVDIIFSLRSSTPMPMPIEPIILLYASAVSLDRVYVSVIQSGAGEQHTVFDIGGNCEVFGTEVVVHGLRPGLSANIDSVALRVKGSTVTLTNTQIGQFSSGFAVLNEGSHVSLLDAEVKDCAIGIGIAHGEMSAVTVFEGVLVRVQETCVLVDWLGAIPPAIGGSLSPACRKFQLIFVNNAYSSTIPCGIANFGWMVPCHAIGDAVSLAADGDVVVVSGPMVCTLWWL
jgi:hypothetical protein